MHLPCCIRVHGGAPSRRCQYAIMPANGDPPPHPQPGPWLAVEFYTNILRPECRQHVWRDVSSPSDITQPRARALFTIAARLVSHMRGWGRSDALYINYETMEAANIVSVHLRHANRPADVPWILQHCCSRVQPLVARGPSPLVQFWVIIGDMLAPGGDEGALVLHVYRPQRPVVEQLPCLWDLA